MSAVALLILQLQFFGSLVCCPFPGHWISGSLRSSQSWKWNKYVLHLKRRAAERGMTFGQYTFCSPINKNPEDKQKKERFAPICMKICPQPPERLVFFHFHSGTQSCYTLTLHQKHTKIKNILTFLQVSVHHESATPSDKHNKQKTWAMHRQPSNLPKVVQNKRFCPYPDPQGR